MDGQPFSRLFCAYRDSPERRRPRQRRRTRPSDTAFRPRRPRRSRGVRVRHNLERERPPLWARASAARGQRRPLRVGGYGGDFASVLASLRAGERGGRRPLDRRHGRDPARSCSSRARLVRPPVVYTAIGLPERLVQLRGGRVRRCIQARSGGTRDRLVRRERGGVAARLARPGGPPVVFVPFGVDAAAFRPVDGVPSTTSSRRRRPAPRLRPAARDRVAPPGGELPRRGAAVGARSLGPLPT